MHDLVYDLKRLAERCREGSFNTQADRKTMLMAIGDQLHVLGFKQMRAEDLKGRHVSRLLSLWQDQSLSPSTIRNRLSALRWWGEKVGKQGVLAKTNAAYGLPPRSQSAQTSKATAVPPDVLAKINDPYVRLSLELQRAFGLRREESIKLRVHEAIQGNMLVLRGSWCKGGRPREIPIRTPEQSALLARVQAAVPGRSGALIPADKRYVDQLRKYEHECSRVGLHKMHGLRHAYAQERFLALTGMACPVMGGPSRASMTDDQVQADGEARLQISHELGHGREQITRAYLG